MVSLALKRSLRLPVVRGVLTENRPSTGVYGVVRQVLFWLERARLERYLSFVLVIGYGGRHGGRALYRRVGFPDHKLFPYGYFVEPASRSVIGRDVGPVKVAFVGQLIERKRCDLLLQGLAHCEVEPWSLIVIGDGPCRPSLDQLTKRLGIAARVEFAGTAQNSEAATRIGQADLLVLPSDFDGWGVVVNEALMQGVPVICSDRCGASDLLGATWRGEVFAAGSVQSLAESLKRWIKKGPASDRDREKIRSWAQCITGNSAANYLTRVLQSVLTGSGRPSAPWLERDEAVH